MNPHKHDCRYRAKHDRVAAKTTTFGNICCWPIDRRQLSSWRAANTRSSWTRVTTTTTLMTYLHCRGDLCAEAVGERRLVRHHQAPGLLHRLQTRHGNTSRHVSSLNRKHAQLFFSSCIKWCAPATTFMDTHIILVTSSRHKNVT